MYNSDNKYEQRNMEDWEFLLQKYSDTFEEDSSDLRLWTSVKTSTMQLQEGKYRIIARSSRTNSDVEIRITHSPIEEGTTKSRSRKRNRRSNPEGLLVILPYTYLSPGIWELSCGGDILADMLGDSWQYNLRLEVSPNLEEDGQAKKTDQNEVGNDNDREPTLDSTETEIPQTANINLFEPSKKEQELKRLQSLSGQILPPRIARDRSIPIPNNLKFPQLPQLVLEENNDGDREFPSCDLSTFNYNDNTEAQSSDLNLQERFWSRLNSLVSGKAIEDDR